MATQIDIELSKAAFVDAIQQSLAQGVYDVCVPPLSTGYVDHVDVTGTPTSVFNAANRGSLTVTLSANVFLALNPIPMNGVPNGAGTPAGSASIAVVLAYADGVHLTVSVSVTPDAALVAALGGSASADLAAVTSALQSAETVAGSLDTNTIPILLASLDGTPFSVKTLPLPSGSLEDLGASIVVHLYAASGTTASRLAGRQWALFLSADAVGTMLQEYFVKYAGAFAPDLTGEPVTWAPIGTTPHFVLTLQGVLPIGIENTFSDAFDLTFTLQGGSPAQLKLVVERNPASVNVDGTDPITNGILSLIFTQVLDSQIQGVFPPSSTLVPGIVTLPPNGFYITASLPSIQLAGGTLLFQALVAVSDGMVFSGSISRPLPPGTDALTVDVSPFPDKFHVLQFCNGPNPGPPLIKPINVTVSALASMVNVGRLCGIDPALPQEIDLSTLEGIGGCQVSVSPAIGDVNTAGALSIAVNGVAAATLDAKLQSAPAPHTLQFVIRTSRGVRAVDLGAPPMPVLDGNGNVTNVDIWFVNNCPPVLVRWWNFPAYNPFWSPDPPIDWWRDPGSAALIQIHLAELSGLDGGELVTLDAGSDGGSSMFVADEEGRLTVPVIAPVRSFDAGTRLGRVDGRALSGVRHTSVMLTRVALLSTPGAIGHRILSGGTTAWIEVDYPDRREAILVGRSGSAWRFPERTPGAPGTPSPAGTPPVAAAVTSTSESSASVSEYPIVGFEDEPLRIVFGSDRIRLVLRDACGDDRTVGALAMWPQIPPSTGGWALGTSGGDRVGVFALDREAGYV